jgi:tetratricopeptide (TPR) repeat protein
MFNCARPGCSNNGVNRCSICLREPYCGGDCQKSDWKSHKLICKTLKKLSHQLQPYLEVIEVFEEVIEEKIENSLTKQQKIRVLLHLISYASHQFGDRSIGKAYRERNDGERIDNWSVEIGILITSYNRLIIIYQSDESFSMIVRDKLKFPICEKMLELLRPWSLDLSGTSHKDSLDKNQINGILFYFSQTERNMGGIHKNRNQFVLAEDHFQRALSFARLYEGEEEKKTNILCNALVIFYELRRDQGNYDEALTFAEKAYNCVAIAYNPVHPKVQKAASTLIECLILKGNFDHAQTFAQMTLDSLKDPGNGLDQQSEAVARGYYDLGNVVNQQKKDYVKAEKLVRESLRIRGRLYDADHNLIGVSIGLLASNLLAQGNLGSETKELYERALVIDIKNYGSEGLNTAASYFNLSTFYLCLRDRGSQSAETKKEHLLMSESKCKEALRIYAKICGPYDPRTKQISSQLSTISRMLSDC